MQNIDKKIDDTFNSFKNIERAEPAPFFYTRLKARMENELSDASTYAANKLRAVFLIPILACSILLSIISIYTVISYGNAEDSSLSSQDAFIQEHGLNEYGSITIY